MKPPRKVTMAMDHPPVMDGWPDRFDHFHRDKVYNAKPNPNAPLGQGGRFAALKNKLATEPGVTNPGGLAAYIGRKKYGAKKMANMSAAGQKGGY